MKMKSHGHDANGRSTWSEVEIPFKQITPLHAETAKQDGGYWGISINQPGEGTGGGRAEMHITNAPRIVWVMAGHLESKMQDGEVRRSGMGDGDFVRGTTLHHSSFARTREPAITLSLTFPGTEVYEFKT